MFSGSPDLHRCLLILATQAPPTVPKMSLGHSPSIQTLTLFYSGMKPILTSLFPKAYTYFPVEILPRRCVASLLPQQWKGGDISFSAPHLPYQLSTPGGHTHTSRTQWQQEQDRDTLRLFLASILELYLPYFPNTPL